MPIQTGTCAPPRGADHGVSLLVHGGAWDIPDEECDDHLDGLHAALARGRALLLDGAPALEVVAETVAVMEAHGAFDAGRGAVLNRDGEVELDAGLMDGETLAYGAVASVRRLPHPIRVARTLLEQSDDRWALLASLHDAARERRLEERAELLLRLAAATDDPRARAELTLHGLRAQIVGADAESEAAEDAFLIAQELASESEDAAAAVAVDETLSAGDDPEAFAEAQLGRVR
ncbi:MAG: hypothetical protein D6685_10740, partial [Bacteroidetes bacterium]